jgi:hypothetical protein
VTHPHHLHARAAAWSLKAALDRLAAASAAQDRANAANGDLGTLQAWRPGSGGHSSGHGDVLLDAVIRHAGTPANPYADRARHTAETIAWVAKATLRDRYRTDLGPLEQLRGELPGMRPATAAHLRRWLDDEDTAVRRLLGEPDDHELLPRLACPACDTAGALALRTSAPVQERVVVCTQQVCVCLGSACRCGMGRQVAGAQHAWSIHEARQIITSQEAA